MTKMPPLVSPYYQPKRIERLIFPKNGDSNIFSKCGRKHFVDKYSRPTPYAIIPGQISSNLTDYLMLKDANAGVPASNHHQHSRTNEYDDYDRKEENVYHGGNQIKFHHQQRHKQALDQQVYSFTVHKATKPIQHYLPANNYRSYEDYRPQEKGEDRHRYSNLDDSRQRRINTQVSNTITPPPYLKPITRKRSRTQATEPGIVKSYFRQPRFNPTFLSSINY